MTNEELISLIRKGNNDARNTLAVQNTPLVYKIMGEFSYLCKDEESKNELFQAGHLGLAKALDRYCEEFNTKFTTFAFRYVRGEIIREVSSLINYRTEMANVAENTDFSSEDIADFVHRSLNGEEEYNVENDAINKILIEKMLKAVNPRQSSILTMHYFMDMSQKEIGEKLGMHQVEVSREEKKARLKLRNLFGDEECAT